jgi:hypothetical protein
MHQAPDEFDRSRLSKGNRTRFDRKGKQAYKVLIRTSLNWFRRVKTGEVFLQNQGRRLKRAMRTRPGAVSPQVSTRPGGPTVNARPWISRYVVSRENFEKSTAEFVAAAQMPIWFVACVAWNSQTDAE